MDTDDTEIPFGDGVDNRGVDDDDENIPLVSNIFAARFRRHNLSLFSYKNSRRNIFY